MLSSGEMSRASATVTFPDGEVFYALYNGTVDHLIPNLFYVEADRDHFWSRFNQKDGDHGNWKPCGCEGEPATAEHTYGRGQQWEGKACRLHLLWLGPTHPDAWMYPEEDRWTW